MKSEEIIQHIYELVTDIKDTQAEIKSNLAAHVAAQEQLCRARGDTLLSLDKAINGNGKPGLCSEVCELRQHRKLTVWALGAIGAIMLALTPMYVSWMYTSIKADITGATPAVAATATVTPGVTHTTGTSGAKTP